MKQKYYFIIGLLVMIGIILILGYVKQIPPENPDKFPNQQNEPELINQLIAREESGLGGAPTETVEKCIYKDQPVYHLIAECCDRYNGIYNKNGDKICYTGGATGLGDGKCPDFYEERKNCEVVWGGSLSNAGSGVYYAGFVFDSERNFCVRESYYGGPGLDPFEFKTMQQCEDANNVEVNKEIDVIAICTDEANQIQIDKDFYKYESLVKNVKNNCIFDFALAKRDVELCNSIDNDRGYLKGDCIREVAIILNDKNICESITDVGLKRECIFYFNN